MYKKKYSKVDCVYDKNNTLNCVKKSNLARIIERRKYKYFLWCWTK